MGFEIEELWNFGRRGDGCGIVFEVVFVLVLVEGFWIFGCGGEVWVGIVGWDGVFKCVIIGVGDEVGKWLVFFWFFGMLIVGVVKFVEFFV